MSKGRFVSLPNGGAAFEPHAAPRPYLERYRDPEKRKTYMRELMREKRAQGLGRTGFLGLRLEPSLMTRVADRAKALQVPMSEVVRDMLDRELPK